jgi:hypothetical protein
MPTGSCLCGAVTWNVEGKIALAHACHCTMCRKTHGTAYGAYGNGAISEFRWNGGEDAIRTYRSSDTVVRPFCSRCGSTVPNRDPDGARMAIPLGSLEGPGLDLELLAHIFVASKAPWDEITDTVPQFEAWPPGYEFPVLPSPQRAQSSDRITGSCL